MLSITAEDYPYIKCLQGQVPVGIGLFIGIAGYGNKDFGLWIWGLKWTVSQNLVGSRLFNMICIQFILLKKHNLEHMLNEQIQFRNRADRTVTNPESVPEQFIIMSFDLV